MLPSLEVIPDQLVKAPSKEIGLILSQRDAWFRQGIEAGLTAVDMNLRHTALIDALLIPLASHAKLMTRRESGGEVGRFSILALGGYGRREMSPRSDIDLLFLYDRVSDEVIRNVADAVFYPFWDHHVEIGGATRTLDDCLAMIHEDVRALTAMLDARLLVGDPRLAKELSDRMVTQFRKASVRRCFVESKVEEQRARLKRFGGSIYLLQPNIKEGEGGLREMQTVEWIARVFHELDPVDVALLSFGMTETSRKNLAAGVEFLWRARHALHLTEGKKKERLNWGVQPEVAKLLRFQDGNGESGVEQLLRTYYAHAAVIHRTAKRVMEQAINRTHRMGWARRFLHGVEKKLSLPRKELSDPIDLLTPFVVARQKGLEIDAASCEWLEAHREVITPEVWKLTEVQGLWRKIFSQVNGLAELLSTMHDCRLLDRWFPEMTPILHRVQFGSSHAYTIDAHLLRAIAELEEVFADKEEKKIRGVVRKISQPYLLTAATFFHDVGKGREGDHSQIGAELVQSIATRMGYSERDARDIAFLVRSHLLMSNLAFHRDVLDQRLIERFVASIRSPELLPYLYLLTIADIRAVGPGVWSDWKGRLLWELYSGAERFVQSLPATVELRQILAVLPVEGGEEVVRSHLDSLPKRYASSFSAESIASHVRMLQQLNGEKVLVEVKEHAEGGLTELHIVTFDMAGLFARIAGVLTYHAMNIIDARLFTTTNGIAVDAVRFTDLLHQPVEEKKILNVIVDDLKRAISGRVNLDELIRPRLQERLLARHAHLFPAHVEIDNDVSSSSTVVEVHAGDRRGLLYLLTKFFYEMDFSIERARIATRFDRIVDVFYLMEKGGGKIVSKERLEEIRTRLEKELA